MLRMLAVEVSKKQASWFLRLATRTKGFPCLPTSTRWEKGPAEFGQRSTRPLTPIEFLSCVGEGAAVALRASIEQWNRWQTLQTSAMVAESRSLVGSP